VGQYFTEWCYS